MRIPELLILWMTCLSSDGAILESAASNTLELEVPSSEGPRSPEDRFGDTIVEIGDVDDDGVADFAIGAPLAQDTDGSTRGKVHLVSGRDFTRLRTIVGPHPGGYFGDSIASIARLPGITGGAILVGASYGAGSVNDVHVVSCVSGKIVRTYPAGTSDSAFGNEVVNCGDVNSDGYDDYGITFVGRNVVRDDSGVRVFSGANGSLLLQCGMKGVEVRSFRAICGGYDWDGDRAPDVVLGGLTHFGRARQEGILYFFSGKTGQLFDTVSIERRNFGASIAAMGDVDDDGVIDLVVGSPGEEGSDSSESAMVVLSGRTHGVLWMVRRRDASFGSAVSCVSDLDDDGHRDIVVSAPDACDEALTDPHAYTSADMCAGHVTVFSARTRKQLFRLEGRAWFERFGSSIGATVSGKRQSLWVSSRPVPLFQNVDGRPDVFVGAPLVRVYALPERNCVAELSAAGFDR